MKIKTKLKACFICILSAATGIQAGITSQAEVSAADSATVTFSASVVESLSVTIDQTNIISESGAAGDLLTSSFDITVTTNDSAGFSASMFSSDSNTGTNKTDLVNKYATGTNGLISTLTSTGGVAKASIPANQWGYSLDNSTYRQMKDKASPITILSSEGSPNSNSGTIYFATKVDSSKIAGSYENKVTINVVSPYTTSPSAEPSDPVLPTYDDPSDTVATLPGEGVTPYVNSSANTVKTTVDGSGNQTTTQIISGNYTGEVSPLGVTESTYYTTSETTGGSSLLTGLMVASATAAVSGGLFFLLSRSRDDDEEENY